jgi:hypothetical protein
MLRKALLQGLLLVSGLAATSVAAAANMLVDDPPMVAAAPFSGVVDVQSVTTFTDGNRIVRNNSMRYFRDGQGRTRTEHQGLNPQGVSVTGSPTVVINDPVSGRRLTLLPKFQAAMEFKLQKSLVSLAAAVSAYNDSEPPFALLGIGMALGAGQSTEASTSTTSLGQKQINGLNVTGTRIVRTIPVGVLGNEKPITSTVEQWVSTDLGVVVQFTQTSSVGGSVSFALGQVVRAEPDPALFTVPANYKVQNVSLPDLSESVGAMSAPTVTFSNTTSGTSVSR